MSVDRIRSVVVAAAALLALIVGCGSTGAGSGTATDTGTASGAGAPSSGAGPATEFDSIELTWNTGSLPPPYNYTVTLRAAGDIGELLWKTGHTNDDQLWTREFPLDGPARADLDSAVADILAADWRDPEDPQVGGPVSSYSVVTADGTIHEDFQNSGEQVSVIDDLIISTVPNDLYAEVEAEYFEWQATQE